MADLNASPGDNIEVDFDVSNTGGVEDTQDIFLTADDGSVINVDSLSNLTLQAGESTSDTLVWTDAPEGSYNLCVESSDTTDCISVSVFDIPDTSMFQSPIYQWSATAGLSASNGQTASDWGEQLAGLGDATANGNPIYQSDQVGKNAVEYGSGDSHSFNSDALLPTGTDPLSVAATLYVPSDHFGTWFVYGDSTDGNGIEFSINGGSVRIGVFGSSYPIVTSGSHPTGSWFTIGGTIDYDGTNSIVEAFVSGSSVGTASESAANLAQNNEAIGIDATGRVNGDFVGYIYDLVVCDVVESQTAFSQYNSSRL